MPRWCIAHREEVVAFLIISSVGMGAIRRYDKDGNEYWSARELMEILGYQHWETFGGQKKGQTSVVQKAIKSLKNSGYQSDDHVRYASKMVNLPQGGYRTKKDWDLSRRACYVMAMNGDPNKKEIALAQAYFTDQARENELRKSREATKTESGKLKISDEEALKMAIECLEISGVDQPVISQFKMRQLAKLDPEHKEIYESVCGQLASAYTLENKPILVTKVGAMICDRLGLNRNMISFAKTINEKLVEVGLQEKDIRYKDNKAYSKGYVLTEAGKPWAISTN